MSSTVIDRDIYPAEQIQGDIPIGKSSEITIGQRQLKEAIRQYLKRPRRKGAFKDVVELRIDGKPYTFSVNYTNSWKRRRIREVILVTLKDANTLAVVEVVKKRGRWKVSKDIYSEPAQQPD